MGEFKGIERDALFLLELNKFNDSKDFYEANKEVLKNGITVPVRLLCSELSDELYKIDPKMNLIPTKMVSRIRRDTRRSKNKNLYRDNVWCMFMRDKNQYPVMPCMWFEFYPGSYNIGVGIFYACPSFMEIYRKHFSENQERYKKAIKKIEALGALPDFESYKKPKEGSENIQKSLLGYYNVKYLYFIKTSDEIENIFSEKILDELKLTLKAFAPFYKLLVEVMEIYFSKGE